MAGPEDAVRESLILDSVIAIEEHELRLTRAEELPVSYLRAFCRSAMATIQDTPEANGAVLAWKRGALGAYASVIKELDRLDVAEARRQSAMKWREKRDSGTG